MNHIPVTSVLLAKRRRANSARFTCRRFGVVEVSQAHLPESPQRIPSPHGNSPSRHPRIRRARSPQFVTQLNVGEYSGFVEEGARSLNHGCDGGNVSLGKNKCDAALPLKASETEGELTKDSRCTLQNAPASAITSVGTKPVGRVPSLSFG